MGSLSSIGYLAASLNMSVGRLLVVAVQIGVTPTVYINGVGHFDQDAEDRIRKHLAEATKVTT
jgi:hypothetical protein